MVLKSGKNFLPISEGHEKIMNFSILRQIQNSLTTLVGRLFGSILRASSFRWQHN